MKKLREKEISAFSPEQKKFEILGEVNFSVRAQNLKKAGELAQSVIDQFLDGRLFKDMDVLNPWVEVKNVIELK